jgi:hypothetical protein
MDQCLTSDKARDLPNELVGRTPRRVRLTGVGWAHALLSVSLCIFGAALVPKALRASDNEKATQGLLRQNGAESLGRVARTWKKGMSSYISYSFSVDGIVYFGEVETPIDVWNRLHQGDSLPVRYLPADPNGNHPAAWESPSHSILWALIAGWPALLSFIFVWRFPSQYRLAREGVPAWASIAEREWIGPSEWAHRESYTFRNADDKVESGRCPMDVSLKAGATVCVLYLPAKPSRSTIYPLDFFETNQ